jgi:hypothetical protein
MAPQDEVSEADRPQDPIALKINAALIPPKAKEFDIATGIGIARP